MIRLDRDDPGDSLTQSALSTRTTKVASSKISNEQPYQYQYDYEYKQPPQQQQQQSQQIQHHHQQQQQQYPRNISIEKPPHQQIQIQVSQTPVHNRRGQPHQSQQSQQLHLPLNQQKQQNSNQNQKKTIKLNVSSDPYLKNAAVKRLKHPLEENIFSGLFLTLIAVALAIVLGIPVLLFIGVTLVLVLLLRYLTVILVDSCHYIQFICSNRNVPNRAPPPNLFTSSEGLALANDVRWLGNSGIDNSQPILHAVLVFEGQLDLHTLRHLVQSRVLRAESPDGELMYPRLVQKLVPLVAGYRWELDVRFDIQNHIFHGPAQVRTEFQIQEFVASLLCESLSMGKPMWEIILLPNFGLKVKDTIAILRVHQCLADGMTLVRILSHSLADHSQMHIPQRPHFAGLSFGFNVLRSFIVGPLTFFLWLFTNFRDKNLFSKPIHNSNTNTNSNRNSNANANANSNSHCNSSSSNSTQNNGNRHNKKRKKKVITAENISTTNIKGKQLNQQRGPTSNNRDLYRDKNSSATSSPSSSSSSFSSSSAGLWKVAWSSSMTMPKVSRVKQIMRSSFNDVMLGATAGSVRTYLQKQGVAYPDNVKVVIPVDLRNDIASPKSSSKLGCKVAAVLATLPSGTESAIPRLWSTRHRLDELKASADPVVAYGATAVLMNILPHKLAKSVLDFLTNKASLQFCNLPGPSSTLVVGGYPLKGIFPIYPPSGKIRTAISVFTYADQVHVTVVAHNSMENASVCLLNGISNQIDQLSRQLSQRRVPGESRRSARNMSTNNAEITRPPTRQIHIQLQVVQEELQQLSSRLDLDMEMDQDEQERFSSSESLGMQLSPGGQTELRTRLKSLKNEFSELIGELRRRSSIVDGIAMSFEDEELEDEFRKPRKRALSVVSVGRRNSIFSARSLTTPDSSHCYSSDEDLSSSASDMRMYSPNLRHNSPSIRTTAV